MVERKYLRQTVQTFVIPLKDKSYNFVTKVTRLPSNLRPTTREWVHLVTRNLFLSCDKDGGHTIRSALSEDPMLHANFMAFIEPELLPIEELREYGFSTFLLP